ncbi:MAG: HPF/RaiA family ribosome-associated protein [Saprospiraceae bacterium]|nr:HPF/RaiA family ribosome-associated protein [Saprospiraceae bacterium]MCF8249989.1 HPF/RaiA family ribosome-associated protein [Saprospiraceae bacterium]MCF8278971.1 HPF/RaiA family ribosome-associated protein [Bacteroidales bacterium]MCF8311002.1 HPF/RaiA family ribosome-associated protein [Saprospiraceae bacterium]MCF8439662.1 HPF/RaiA family ribosome-associated protein [Saprospiraceae bacterium]
MTIQFNTDRNVAGKEVVTAPLTDLIADGLSRFSHQISRVEVHLSDENSHKDGQNDKRCMLEARLEGMGPIAVTNFANTRDQAVEGAIVKLISTLEKTLGRLANH